MENIITRFAPSPTGELHVGNARTALFEYLFAKHNNGEFLLRIEDTDRERFVEGATERIIESLQWLRIAPENLDNVMVQSNRLDIYQKAAFSLIEKGDAYICTCDREKLAQDREQQEKEGKPSRYEGYCRDLNLQLSDVKDRPYVIRMKMPGEGKIVVNDMIRGNVEFDLGLSDDQVLLKSDGFPTYHLAAVVDDHDMNITHIIRGEEWLSSTPKHLILYKMFGFNEPKYAHLPMILAPDRTKLSKRHGATSVKDFRNLGYLPEALVNFMALLGWSSKDDREIFTISELIAEFKVENIQKSPAIFNIDKLNNINEHYLRELFQNDQEKAKILLKDFGVENIEEGELNLLTRGGFKTLKEMADYISSLRNMPEYNPEILVFKKSSKEVTILGINAASEKLQQIDRWESDPLQQALAEVVSEKELSNGDVFWPIRVALSGSEKSPSPVELLLALGKDESLSRIEKAISKLS